MLTGLARDFHPLDNAHAERTKESAPRIAPRGASSGGGYLLSRVTSTIGVAGLNFPVRNGEGWNPRAMTALLFLLYVSGTLAPPPRRPQDVVLKKSLIGSKLTVESVFFCPRLAPPAGSRRL